MCLNTLYEWFSLCPLGPMDEHLDKHGLMAVQQGGGGKLEVVG